MPLQDSVVIDLHYSMDIGIKPHGSVNCGRPIRGEFDETWIERPPEALKALDDGIVWSRGNLNNYRAMADGTWLYPALSVPLGSPDELVCPPEHLAWLKSRLVDVRVHLSVIGYSALDQEVLSLLAEAEAVPVTGRVVVNGHEEALMVRDRLQRAFGRIDVGSVAPAAEAFEAFEAFVHGDGLNEYLREVRDSTWSPWS